jgi:Flp pilus assembly pilin Flp
MFETTRRTLGAVARRVRRDEGQALVEYTLVLGLICLVSIALLDAVGTSVTGLLSRVADALASAI